MPVRPEPSPRPKVTHRLYSGKIFYLLKGGFLVRTFGIAFGLTVLGTAITFLERRVPEIDSSFPLHAFPVNADPGYAQGILSTVAGAVMTVVSIVFAIVLMTLTLASNQFSPRIVVGFTRDRVTQWTLGLFLGTFSYSVTTMGAIRPTGKSHIPVVGVSICLLLALLCVGWLLFFINHIALAISANHIVDRLARETETIVAQTMPRPIDARHPYPVLPEIPDFGGLEIVSVESGYVRYIDLQRLIRAAKNYGFAIRVMRRVGHFVPEGVAMVCVSRPEKVTPAIVQEILEAFDLGPTRTLQQDVEYGILQIVDIALKAISPAVNDPSTGIGCVDQLSRILIQISGRQLTESLFYDPPGVLRLAVPTMDLERYVYSAYEQIRIYSKGDVAVSLRLLRALNDISSVATDYKIRTMLSKFGEKVVESSHLDEHEMSEMRRRLEGLQELVKSSTN